MAKINHIQIGDKIRYIENISYQNSLPTATSDSADFVSVNNTLYAKQSFNGEYMYSQVGSGSGAEIIDITMTELEEEDNGMLAFAELDQATYLKINSDSFVIIRLLTPAESGTQIAYFLTPAMGTPPIFSDDDSPIKIYSCSVAGTMNVILIPLTQENDSDGTILYFAEIMVEQTTKVVANNSASTTATLTKLKVDGVNYAVPGVTEEQLDTKQDTLVSGTNIKTINGNSLLGSGDIEISGGSGDGSAISIVDSLPTANEENFEKGKIYTQGELLQYISKVAVEEGVLSQVSSLPVALSFTSAAAVGNDIYVFGGSDSSYNRANTIYKYSTTKNEIATMSATLPVALSNTSAAAVGNDIYIFGGQTSGSSSYTVNTIYKYSTTTDAITTMSATLPQALSYTSAAAVGTDIYIFGGSNSNSIYKYSTTSNTITTMSTTLPAQDYGTSAAAVGTDIYIFGGNSGGYFKDTIYKYSTTTGAITKMSTTLPTKTYATSAVAVGTDIYIFGGYNSYDLYKYSTTTDTITDMSKTLYWGNSAAAVGSDIYIFGGSNGSSSFNTIYKYALGFNYSFETLLDSDTGVTEEEVNNLITSNETIITLTGDIRDLQTDKQDTLVSGTNIKTVNGESILGEGNIEISGGGTEVVANNGEATTNTLSTLKVGDTNYAVPQGGSETETIVEVNLTGATFDETTYSVNIPNQSVELTEEQIEITQTNKNVVIKATIDIENQGASASLFVYLKPFPSAEGYGENETCINVWYGFSQLQAGTIKGYNVGLKCILSYSGSLVFESIGLINEGSGTETIIEVNLTDVTFEEITHNLNVPTQRVVLTEEQFETILTNKNVVIKAIVNVSETNTIEINLKPFNTQLSGLGYAKVWYGFFQIEIGFKGYTVGLKCILSLGGEALLFESIGLINEGETEVVANNGEETTGTLNTLKVGETNYAIPSGGDSPITIVDSLPTANEENYLKGKIYTQGDLLKYIAKLVAEEPNLSQVASMVNTTYAMGAANVGTNIYLFGGGNYLNTISKFDTTTNTLTTLSETLPTGAKSIAAAAVGTNIYLFGGEGSSNTINKFDTTTETISTLSTTLPKEAYSIGTAAVGSNIYLFGGGNTNDISKFDTTTNTLTTLSAKLPKAGFGIAAAAVGSNIYLFGGYGYSDDSRLNTINKFDTNSNSITTLSTTLPTGASDITAAAVGSNIYLFGGYGSNRLNTINKFDTNSNSITTLSTTLPKANNGIGAAAIGTNIYLLSGASTNAIYKVSISEYYEYKTLPNLDTITNAIEMEY